ncbi:hypothetical protein Tco_0977419 [Tanacetum coccineum]|uniref:Uncharacterized protein n=1 Tax=Tanacetum coccineum TaxID=301880 RepID=A0ABQ5EKI0_9ASTR
MQKPTSDDDECYGVDDLDDTINEETQESLRNDQFDSFLLKDLEKMINQTDLENCNCVISEFINDPTVESLDQPYLCRSKEGRKTIGTPKPVFLQNMDAIELLQCTCEFSKMHDTQSSIDMVEELLAKYSWIDLFTEITDEFPDEHLMMLKAKLNDVEPWYADYVNFLIEKVVPPKWNSERRKRFYSQVKNYFWDAPYAFGLCPDNIIRRCVAGSEILEILAHCHFGPIRGYPSALVTRRKMYPGKLISKWYGLNTVKTVYPYRAIEITDKNEFSFKVNGQQLKKYYSGSIDKEDNEVVEFEEDATTPVTDEIDFRISFDESDDEDYTIISYGQYVDDLDFFKDFENESPVIVYNDAQMSKSDYLTKQTLSPQHTNESDLKDETSLSKYDKVGQNVLYFNDLFPFNVIHPDDLKSNKDNDNNEIDVIQSSEGSEITHGSNVIRIKQYFQIQDYALWEVIENGVVIAQEDLNSKFLNSLPPEWNTYVVVWMNKAKIETMSIDDLYNNFKIVEQSVKKSVGVSSGAQNLAFMTAPSTSSTNDVNTAIPAYEVSTASPNINVASPQVITARFSDNVVYAFMIENTNGSNLLQQVLEQIHEDYQEAMDLKWQLSLLSMRAKRWGTLQGVVEHRNKEVSSEIKTTPGSMENNEDTSSKEMLAIDGVGFD